MAQPVYDSWFVRVNDVSHLWNHQPTYVISQAIYVVGGLLTLLHAFSKGGRWPYFWVGILLHGFVADNFWAIVVPEFDNFWHSQTPIIFLGGRLPLHILLLYPVFIYNAAYAVSKLNLPKYAEPFAVGLVTVLIDIPYDIVAVKFVHWVWHDTDPNIFDRHYWVPWNSYYFHATFAASFFYLFHATRRYLAPKVPQWTAAGLRSEFLSLLISSTMGMFGGVLMFVPIYHPLHDMYKIHSEVTFFLLFAIYSVFILQGLLSDRPKNKDRLTAFDYLLLLQLIVHYLAYWCFVMFMYPEKEVSVGFHQPVGPCDEKESLVTPFGQTLYKNKYLCASNYDEKYYDFRCVGGKIPPNGSKWYTICGTPFENRAEYITVISAILIVAFGVFRALYFKNVEILPPLIMKKKNK
ncbi:uncharacterized protein LOC110995516 [Pieris rapae]|uniref:uncharacterized protein LOC110995516 n=1 Tax=Pieris rapae TaxID=64459 RepID=UPI001E27A2D9|nr:uncharacterized protein LOC110995516 [Pieris rapae]